MISYTVGDGPSQTVLVVDDEPGNRELLITALSADGYQVVVASRGEEALSKVEAAPPDIVLLDIAMPGMDGIEVCRRLHVDPKTTHIPVLLMTALRRREKRLDGISAGARDFLLKPLDLADLRIRVRNAGEMKRLYDESEERFQKITELEALRDSLVHMIVHDLKSPLTTMMGNLQLMEMLLAEVQDSDIMATFEGCVTGARKMSDLVTTILAVSKLESDTVSLDLAETDLYGVAEEVCSSLGQRASRVKLSDPPASGGVILPLDAGLVQRVILNLLTNALDHSPEEHPVVIHVSEDDDVGRVRVVDRGPGVPEEFREQIFEKFGQVAGGGKARKGSVGLGLAFCRLAVEAHAGRIGVESSEEGGSAFWFELPLKGPNVEATGVLEGAGVNMLDAPPGNKGLAVDG
jgi:two-component system sensor histidine kinase/response regulator